MIEDTPLWTPSEERVANSNMKKFMDFVSEKHGQEFTEYDQLHEWSVANLIDFWAAWWEFGDFIHSKGYDKVIDDPDKMPGAKWFPGAELNFAENLLRYRDNRLALIFQGEGQETTNVRTNSVTRCKSRQTT